MPNVLYFLLAAVTFLWNLSFKKQFVQFDSYLKSFKPPINLIPFLVGFSICFWFFHRISLGIKSSPKITNNSLQRIHCSENNFHVGFFNVLILNSQRIGFWSTLISMDKFKIPRIISVQDFSTCKFQIHKANQNLNG